MLNFRRVLVLALMALIPQRRWRTWCVLGPDPLATCAG
jgi:hypothetical protein